MTTATYNGRTVARMHDSIRAGQSYGCAITRYESRNQRIWRKANRAMYWIAPFAILFAVLA